MKNLIIIFSLLIFSANLFGQRLEEKPISNLDKNTLFAVQDSGQLYNWRKVDFETLKGVFNLFRTPSGNVAGVDSIVKTPAFQGNFKQYYNAEENAKNGVIELKYQNEGHSAEVVAVSQFTPNWGRGSFIGAGIYTNEQNPVILTKPALEIGVSFNNSDEAGNWMSIDSLPNGILFRVAGTWGEKTGYSSAMRAWRFLDIHRSYTNFFVDSSFSIYQKNYYSAATNNEGNSTLLFNLKKEGATLNTTLKATKGINLAQLSYTPTSSTDLQAEASSAEIGTMWQLNVSGSWYIVTKISSTKLARAAYAEW